MKPAVECDLVVSSSLRDGVVRPRYRWDVAPLASREHLASFKPIPDLLIQLLWNRQIREPEAIGAFMAGADSALHSPWLMRGIAEAVERIVRAREAGETVAVYGDYDVDGITSTTLLSECLRLLGVTVIPFLPLRDVDGYGLNNDSLGRLRAQGAALVVAVDCGITGGAEVDYARQIGLDVIIADHHHVPPEIPRAVAVIDPGQSGCAYPFKGLCGVGVTYKLAQALLERCLGDGGLADRWLDLVTLGTVADIVPLKGENRVLVLRGLPRLNPTERVGLRALASRADYLRRPITAESIAFALAPRLNAAGRLDDAELSLRLLLSEADVEAQALAETLEQANRERQQLTTAAFQHASQWIQSRESLPRILLVADESYRSGVVGLVASKLVEAFGRPAVVAQIGDDKLRGSARSIEGFHIAEALARCDDLLERHGGHAGAAGFTALRSNLDRLRERLEAIAEGEIADEDLEPRLKIDAELRLARHDQNLPELLARLEPFGCENPRPTFVSRRLRVLEWRVIGRERPGHLTLKVADGASHWDAIGFSMGERFDRPPEFLDLVYQVERHEWNGRGSARLRLLDLQGSIPG